MKRRWLQFFAFAVAAPLLASCTTYWELAEVRDMAVKGNDFTKALHKEYVALAHEEISEADFSNAGFFNARARLAANGEQIYPTRMNERTIPAANVDQLSEARIRLMNAIYAGGPTKAPALAARAQAMFDCWMEEQEENIQAEDIARCRREFVAAFDQLWKILNPPVAAAAAPAPAVQPAPAPRPAPVPVVETFTVVFAHNSATLDTDARVMVIKAAAYAISKKSIAVVVSGHADRSGSQGYNRRLADRRAAAVAKAIQAAGVQARVSTQSFGEDEPAVPTADDVKEPRNRRVEIRIQ